jgi:hypothetical protein
VSRPSALPQDNTEALHKLSKAYDRSGVTLYLGAGVSRDSGMPTWQSLVVSMYYAALQGSRPMKSNPAYSNYLFAIAEWHLDRERSDAEITARKIRQLVKTPDAFLSLLKETLWGGFREPNAKDIILPGRARVLEGNRTLKSVANLCIKEGRQRKIRSVVSYNFDSLLEKALPDGECTAIWKDGMKIPTGRLPVYHVHGFVPANSPGSDPEDIIFTEDQFHRAANDPLSWLNLVQIQALTSSTCLMVGLSLNDRNLRRLLELLRRLPLRRTHYAILKQKSDPDISALDIQQIENRAAEYRDRLMHSGIKAPERLASEIKSIIGDVHTVDVEQQAVMLRELGIQPIWCKEYSEVPGILDCIRSPSLA